MCQHLQTTEDCEKNIVDIFISELRDSIEPDFVSNYFRRFKIEGSGNVKNQLLSIMSRGGLAKSNRLHDSVLHSGTNNLMGERSGFDKFAKTLE